jgi:hypothetical protein
MSFYVYGKMLCVSIPDHLINIAWQLFVITRLQYGRLDSRSYSRGKTAVASGRHIRGLQTGVVFEPKFYLHLVQE